MKTITALLSILPLSLYATETNINFFLQLEKMPKHDIEMVIVNDDWKELKRLKVMPWLNEITLDSDLANPTNIFEFRSSEYYEYWGYLEEILPSEAEPLFLFTKRTVLVEYSISENGPTFDSDDQHGEEWVTHGASLPVMNDDFLINQVGFSFEANYHRVQDGFGIFPNLDQSLDYKDIKKVPETGYVYENPPLLLNRPVVFKICGCPQRENTFVKLVARDIKLMQNQRLEPTLKTPADSVNTNSSEAHP